MKMLMIVCPENRQEEVRAIIAKHEVRGYSEIQNVLGEGATGKHLGTHVWPGKSVLVFTVVAAAKKDELVQAQAGQAVRAPGVSRLDDLGVQKRTVEVEVGERRAA